MAKCHISKTEARREIILYVTVMDGVRKDGSLQHVHLSFSLQDTYEKVPNMRLPSFEPHPFLNVELKALKWIFSVLSVF